MTIEKVEITTIINKEKINTHQIVCLFINNGTVITIENINGVMTTMFLDETPITNDLKISLSFENFIKTHNQTFKHYSDNGEQIVTRYTYE